MQRVVEFNNLIHFLEIFGTEETCRHYLTKIIWKNGGCCPHCEAVYLLSLGLFRSCYSNSVISGAAFQNNRRFDCFVRSRRVLTAIGNTNRCIIGGIGEIGIVFCMKRRICRRQAVCCMGRHIRG